MNSSSTALCFVNCCGSTTDCGASGVRDWLYSADILAHVMCQGGEGAVMRGAALNSIAPGVYVRCADDAYTWTYSVFISVEV